jgi:hypothetical protein
LQKKSCSDALDITIPGAAPSIAGEILGLMVHSRPIFQTRLFDQLFFEGAWIDRIRI